MDEAKLQEIEARANAATPGPWYAGNGHPYVTTERMGFGIVVARALEGNDCTFIAHARTDVPVLIAEVRRLTAALATVTTERDALLAVCERFAGDEGVICNGYEDDSGCGSCGANANHSDADPANHAPDCARLAARVLAAKIRALPLDAPGGAPDCTGITAQWCPRCGDCTCPWLHERNVAGGRTLNDPKCPLHAPSSPHGDAPGGAT